MSSLPLAPPLSLGTFGQHSPQHQVHPHVKLLTPDAQQAHVCTA
jgi:hypothetical protein